MTDGGTPMTDAGTPRADVVVLPVDAVAVDAFAPDARDVSDAGEADVVTDAGDPGEPRDATAVRDARDGARDVDPADDIPDGAISIDDAVQGGCQCRAGAPGFIEHRMNSVWIALGAMAFRRRRSRRRS